MQVVETYTAKETFQLGVQMGEKAGPGSVYCLDGDLGTGKTVFSQGLARGLSITEPVVSPTFTIVQEYDSGRLPFYHLDVYRIEDEEEMEEIGYTDYFYGDGVCLVEWGGRIRGLLPDTTVYITIEKNLRVAEDYRKITIAAGGEAERARLLL